MQIADFVHLEDIERLSLVRPADLEDLTAVGALVSLGQHPRVYLNKLQRVDIRQTVIHVHRVSSIDA